MERYHRCSEEELNPLVFVRRGMKCPLCNGNVEVNKPFIVALCRRLLDNIADMERRIMDNDYLFSEADTKSECEREKFLLKHALLALCGFALTETLRKRDSLLNN